MAGIGEGHGVGAALDQAMNDGDRRHQVEAVQELLFADDQDPATTGNLDAPSPLSAMFQPRQRGRPKGSKNRMTQTLAAWLLQNHRHPVAVMMEAYSMTPEQLAERIGLSRARVEVKHKGEGGEAYTETFQLDEFGNDTLLEVFKLQLRMAEAAARYVAQAMPQAVQLQGGGDFTLSIGGVSFPAQGGASEAGGEGPKAGPAWRLAPLSQAAGRTEPESE